MKIEIEPNSLIDLMRYCNSYIETTFAIRWNDGTMVVDIDFDERKIVSGLDDYISSIKYQFAIDMGFTIQRIPGCLTRYPFDKARKDRLNEKE